MHALTFLWTMQFFKAIEALRCVPEGEAISTVCATIGRGYAVSESGRLYG
eukprot:COSAG01_NODE_11700_length_1877_cov_1.623735_4_plen_50_part_00